jgi:flavin-binding protein dodecin
MPSTRITTEVISDRTAHSIEEALQEGVLRAGANTGVESVRVKDVDVLFELGKVVGYRVSLEVTYADELETTLEDEGEGFGGVSQLELLRQRVLLEALTQGELDKSERFLVITPAEKGSGNTDVSVNHDRYLAED